MNTKRLLGPIVAFVAGALLRLPAQAAGQTVRKAIPAADRVSLFGTMPPAMRLQVASSMVSLLKQAAPAALVSVPGAGLSKDGPEAFAGSIIVQIRRPEATPAQIAAGMAVLAAMRDGATQEQLAGELQAIQDPANPAAGPEAARSLARALEKHSDAASRGRAVKTMIALGMHIPRDAASLAQFFDLMKPLSDLSGEKDAIVDADVIVAARPSGLSPAASAGQAAAAAAVPTPVMTGRAAAQSVVAQMKRFNAQNKPSAFVVRTPMRFGLGALGLKRTVSPEQVLDLLAEGRPVFIRKDSLRDLDAETGGIIAGVLPFISKGPVTPITGYSDLVSWGRRYGLRQDMGAFGLQVLPPAQASVVPDFNRASASRSPRSAMGLLALLSVAMLNGSSVFSKTLAHMSAPGAFLVAVSGFFLSSFFAIDRFDSPFANLGLMVIGALLGVVAYAVLGYAGMLAGAPLFILTHYVLAALAGIALGFFAGVFTTWMIESNFFAYKRLTLRGLNAKDPDLSMFAALAVVVIGGIAMGGGWHPSGAVTAASILASAGLGAYAYYRRPDSFLGPDPHDNP